MEAEIIEIIAVEPFSIITKWSDGEIRKTNYVHKINEWHQSSNPLYQQIAQWENFKKVTVRDGVLSWPEIRVEFDFGNGTRSEPFEFDPVVTRNESEIIATSLVPNIGSTLLIARKAAKLTQNDLARRIGTTKQYISKVERGIVSPQTDTLQRIAAAMGRRIIIA